MVRHFKKLAFLFFLGCASAFSEPADSWPQNGSLLDSLPAETVAAIVIHDAGSFDYQLSNWAALFDVNIRPIQAALQSIEIVAGVDWARSAAILLVAGRDQTLRSVLVLPSSDQKSMLMFLNPQNGTGGTVPLTISGQEAFASSLGRYTFFASDRATLLAVVRSAKSSDRAANSVMSAQGASIVLNPPRLRGSTVFRQLPLWLRTMLGSDGAGAGVESISCHARFVPHGLAVTLSARLRSHGGRGTGVDELLLGLPDEPAALAIGLGGLGRDGLLPLFVRSSVAAMASNWEMDAVKIEPLIRVAQSSIRDVKSLSMSVSLFSDSDREYPAVALVARTQGRAELLLNEVETVLSFLRRGVFRDRMLNGLAERLVLLRNMERLGDCDVHELSVDLSGVGQDMTELAGRYFGAEGLTVRVAAPQERVLLVGLGGGRERFQRMALSIQSGVSPLAKRQTIARSREPLALNRSGEIHFSPSVWSSVAAVLGGKALQETERSVASDGWGVLGLSIESDQQGRLQVDMVLPWSTLVAIGKSLPLAND